MSKNYQLTGVSENTELGKKGPRLKNNAGVVENRSNDDGSFAIVRGDHPVGPNDLVTRQFLETHASMVVSGQIDGNSPPAAAAAGTIYICTTVGGTFTLNTLYSSDGTSWNEISHSEGRTISITDDLSGGTVTFLADHLYMWDEDNTTWVNIGPAIGETGVVKSDNITIDFNDVGVNLIKAVPAGSIVTNVIINITQAWDSAATTMTIGDTSDPDRLMEAQGNDPTVVDLYKAENAYKYGAISDINITIDDGGGTPTTGQALVVIQYDLP